MSFADLAKKIQPTTAKILTIDIERLAGTAYAFDPKTRFIPSDRWITRPRTVCWAARWYGQTRVMFEAEWKDPAALVQRSWELYDQADLVVTYNGIRFDNKHLRSLWFEHGLPMPSPHKAVDLFAVVRQFGWEFKSLDDVTRRLGRPGKVQRYDVWQTQSAVDGNRADQRALRTYNIGDVELTEWLYDRLRGWMPNHPHLGTHGDEKRCNQCDSAELKLEARTYQAVVLEYGLFRCQDCGGLSRAGWTKRKASTRGVS